MSTETLTQEQIDAMATPEPTGLVVADIPGVHTAARSGEKEGWRAIRGKTWSATTVTTIVGSNPFASRMDLWRERILGIKPVFSAFAQRIMQYGTDAEPELLEHANQHVAKSEHPEPFTLTHGYVVDDAENPHYGCTPDAFRFVDGVLELAEFKTGSKTWRKTPRSKPVVPQNYVDQMLWQMMVTGARRVLAVQRVVKRDRAGNVLEVLGHNEVWVEYDQKRIDVMLAAVAEWEEMERTGTAPMVHVSAEDSFDDTPEESAEKGRLQEALRTIGDADLALEKVAEWEKKRKDATAVVKAILATRKAQEVTTEYAGLGATLSRSTRTGYDVSMLTEKQRERIRTSTPVDTLRVNPLKEN